MVQTKEERAIYMKEWRAKNKEEKVLYQKAWVAKRLLEDPDFYKKKYQKYSKTAQGLKINTISKWKSRGLINDDYDALYEHYIDTNKCDICQYVFDESNWRCMDHDHETDLFRQVLCHKCNLWDNWKNYVQ